MYAGVVRDASTLHEGLFYISRRHVQSSDFSGPTPHLSDSNRPTYSEEESGVELCTFLTSRREPSARFSLKLQVLDLCCGSTVVRVVTACLMVCAPMPALPHRRCQSAKSLARVHSARRGALLFLAEHVSAAVPPPRPLPQSTNRVRAALPVRPSAQHTLCRVHCVRGVKLTRTPAPTRFITLQVVMVAPTAFTSNAEAAQDNKFMHGASGSVTAQVLKGTARAPAPALTSRKLRKHRENGVADPVDFSPCRVLWAS